MDYQVAKLLVKAVRMLPQREQDRLLTGVLRGALAEPLAFARPLPAPPSFIMGPELPAPAMGSPGQSIMLPVRLTPEVHDRLRRWSTEQGFSMAGVVRGLVERFLDEQQGRTTPKRRGSAKPKSRARRAAARG